MKSVLKKSYLLGLSLLGIFLIVGFVSIVNGLIIKTTPEESEHRVMLHSLYLDGDVDEVLIGTTTDVESLNILNGLSVGGNMEGKLGSIGGGSGNEILSSSYGGGIGGGNSNRINGGKYVVIGGGESNRAQGDNSVVVGGYNGKSENGGVVLGGLNGMGKRGGVVLGGSGNSIGENGLAFGKNANGKENSFTWNGKAEQNTARINADSGVLIGTYDSINGVSLVVSGSVRLGSGKAVKGAINFNANGCITIYDGKNFHVLGKKSSKESSCVVSSGCQFGSILLQNGDFVTGYSVSYSTNCNDVNVKVSCENGNLVDNGGNIRVLGSTIYPYCYKMDDSPIGNGGGGNGGGGNGGGGNGGGGNGGGGNSGFDKCDVNHDGVIDASDMNLMLNCYANGDSNGGWCDINGDGNVDVADWNYFVSGNECNNKIMG